VPPNLLVPPRTRRPRSALLAVALLAGAVIVGVLWSPMLSSSPSLADRAPFGRSAASSAGAGVFDEEDVAVARLDPALLDALRRAASDAADDGVTFVVTSGWRSPERQQQLLDEAISTYGSLAEAARWVATPGTSAHVSGDAVDVGGESATGWLSTHGAGYGLCQIYGNEPWHFELRPDAVDRGCPAMYADPTHDPRMR